MALEISLICSLILMFSTHVKSATIAELIAQRKDTMGRADAAIASNPEWSQPGAYSLFISTDAGMQRANLPSNSLGSILVDKSISFKTDPNYQILKDLKSPNIMVYDNYKGGQDVPEIHCRFGTGEVLAPQQIQADNGWLYIMDGPIFPPGPADVAIKSIGERHGEGGSAFLELVQSLGMTAYLDSFKDVTMWIPHDAAVRALNAAQYTPEQLKSIIIYHITPNIQYSTAFNAGTINSQLQGQTIAVAVGADSLTLNGNTKVVVADTFSSSGVIHLIDRVLIPSQFPTVTIPTITSSTAAPSGTATSSNKPTQPPAKNDATRIVSGILTGLLAYLIL